MHLSTSLVTISDMQVSERAVVGDMEDSILYAPNIEIGELLEEHSLLLPPASLLPSVQW